MNVSEVLAFERKGKMASLERQLKTLKQRQAELRKLDNFSSLDPGFVRRKLDRCDNEIQRIEKILSGM